jgi:hypothetical protein
MSSRQSLATAPGKGWQEPGPDAWLWRRRRHRVNRVKERVFILKGQ